MVYELRLTILLTNSQFVYASVSPLRVQNAAPPFGGSAPIAVATIAVPTQQGQVPNQTTDQSPQAVAQIDANVRLGDSTLFAPIGALLAGQRAPIMGVSTTGSGWSPLAACRTGARSDRSGARPNHIRFRSRAWALRAIRP